MSLIQPGAAAPDFDLDSHLDERLHLAELRGKKHLLIAFYPLDFTPT
jgi:peroxiredoxin